MDLYRRTLSASDILDSGVLLFRKNFRRLFSLSAAMQIIFLSVNTLLNVTSSQITLPAFLNTLDLALTVALLTAALAPAYLGTAAPLRTGFRRAMRSVPTLVPAILPAILIYILLANLPFRGSDILSLGLAFGYIVVRAALYVFCLLPISFSVLEEYRWGANWQHMVRLVRGSFRHVAKTFLALGAAYTLINGIIFLLVEAVYSLFLSVLLRRIGISSYIIENFVTNFSGILTAPFLAAALIVLYYDLRCRQEGLDLETRVRDLAAEPAE